MSAVVIQFDASQARTPFGTCPTLSQNLLRSVSLPMLLSKKRWTRWQRMNVTSAYQRRTEQSYLRQQQVTIELGEFLHRLLNMRRKLLKARTKNMTDGRRKPASVRISAYEPGAVSQACKSSSSLNFPSDGHRIVMNSGKPFFVLFRLLHKCQRAPCSHLPVGKGGRGERTSSALYNSL